MAAIYAGSTPKFLIKVKDEAGIILNPTDTNQVTGVQVFIFNAITGAVFAKFYYGTEPSPLIGWTLMVHKDISSTDIRLQLILSAAQTQAAEGNANKIQVNVSVPDADAPAGTRVIIKTGKFSEILKAKT